MILIILILWGIGFMRTPRKLKKKLKKQGIWNYYKLYREMITDIFYTSETRKDFYNSVTDFVRIPLVMQSHDEPYEDYKKRALEAMKGQDNE